MSDGSETDTPRRRQSSRQVFARGLAISLPAILTIVILLWLIGGISDYIIQPTTASVKYVMSQFVDRSVDVSSSRLAKLTNGPPLRYCGENYLVTVRLREQFEEQERRQRQRLSDTEGAVDSTPSVVLALDGYFALQDQMAKWLEDQAIDNFDPSAEVPFDVYVPLASRAVPYADYVVIARDTPAAEMPTSATKLYMEYAVRRYVGSTFSLSVLALSLVVVIIYFLGRFVSVRLGSWLVSQIENRLLARLPVIRNVYGSAKQVTDFLFSENQVEYRRVVALEYPRRGIWSLALVTGEGMLDITSAIGEPCVSILVPSSPMPVTGYTMCVPRSAILDLDITVDQAFQFCISCGVLVPGHQRVTPEVLQRELARRLAERMQDAAGDRRTLTLPTSRPTDDDEDEPGSRLS